ncbi:MAG: phosphatase PAP2 family protein [Deltaproteobacteria bacterium]|jgi:membrane-associated PAP2 superfamily phosphatase|nr:phosphatase PAP2 family protein [Deltaproteobacteria bacterium]
MIPTGGQGDFKFRPLAHFLWAVLFAALESVPALDRLAQRPLYRDGGWLITETFHGTHGPLLYTGPKILVALAGTALLAAFAVSFLPGDLPELLRKRRRPFLAAALAIAAVPLAVSALKALSGVYGPPDLVPYGGSHPHVGFLGHLMSSWTTAGGRSFPAGHASGGFALVALRFLPAGRRASRLLLALGIAAGWAMGLYQMARGQHFLTHTLVTMFLALYLTDLIAMAILKDGKNRNAEIDRMDDKNK